MINRLASFTLVIALLLTLGGTSAFASTFSDPPDKSKALETPPESSPVTKTRTEPSEKLRADMLKLVAAAKAGKVTPRPGPQIPTGKGNNLSKRAKIAIVAVIALVVVALIITHQIRNAGCNTRCVL